MGSVLWFLVFLFSIGVVSAQFTLSVHPANQPVLIGRKVVLTCQVKGFKPPLHYAVLFKRKAMGISEKCQAYQKTKYRVECEPNDWRQATTYKLHIHSVSWDDRGEWHCIYAANATVQNLVVHAPAELKQMGVTSLQPSIPATSPSPKKHQSAGPAANNDVVAEGRDATLSGRPPAEYVGLGTRTNPYDLRPGLALQLSCETSCGFPDATISWLILNQTMSKPGVTTMGPNQIRTDQCAQHPSTNEMSTTRSVLNVDCVQLALVGLNEVQCAVTGPQYIDHTPTRRVFVLCPAQHNLPSSTIVNIVTSSSNPVSRLRRGERPLKLTSGEVVGIATGAAIALILVLIACLTLRGSRKDSPLPINGYFFGQRV